MAPTVAFDAEVIDWSFDFPPPKGNKRHHVKIVTSVDTPTVDLDITIKAEPGSQLKLEWSAIGEAPYFPDCGRFSDRCDEKQR